MEKLTPKLRERLDKLATTNLSDAMDALGFCGSTYGICPIYPSCRKIVGEAVTLKFVPAGFTKATAHGGVTAIKAAKAGDVIVCDNAGRIDTNTFGGILANACKVKGLSGFVSDGAVRDIDEIEELDFPVYARGKVVATNRGKLIEHGTNIMISFGGLQVRPGDIVVADKSGVIIIPQEKLKEVIQKGEELLCKEEHMISQIQSGIPLGEVDRVSGYENMLKDVKNK